MENNTIKRMIKPKAGSLKSITKYPWWGQEKKDTN